MQTLEKAKIEYSILENIDDTAAIIVAAGSSNRMQGINKIFLPLLKIL